MPIRQPARGEERTLGEGLIGDKMKECRWLKPVLVAQVEFVELTPEGHLRHSSFVGLREDRDVREVKRRTVHCLDRDAL